MDGKIQPILTRLKPLMDRRSKDKPFQIRQLAQSESIAAAKSAKTTVVPAVFVICTADKSTTSDADSCDESLWKEEFGIVIAVSNTDSHRNDKNNTDIADIRSHIKTLLQGFLPEGNFEPMQVAGGTLLGYNDTTLWWADKCSSTYFR